ncbi:MAG: HTR-like protein [Halobacteria archaeon]|nr:HTR-like protein [Halobacteria archaeon]
MGATSGLSRKERIPFGLATLDTMFNGGVPRGSFVLLSGETGAGAPEFAYTSAAMVLMARHAPDRFSVYHGGEFEESNLPSDIHYLSFTRSESDVLNELRYVLNEEMYEILTENLVFRDFSKSYFHNTAVPRSWIGEELRGLKGLGASEGSEGLLSEFADYLDRNAGDNLIIIDSLTSLVRATNVRIDWSDLLVLLAGLQKMSKEWNGLIYGLLDEKTLTQNRHEEISATLDGTLHFEWAKGEMQRQRTMYIGSFRGAMAELSENENDVYETSVTDEGFEISSIRKYG